MLQDGKAFNISINKQHKFMIINMFSYKSTISVYTLIILFLVIGCSPKITKITYEDDFKKWNKIKQINETDTSSSLMIYYNTYKGFFEGRESFLNFKKNIYCIDFTKIDTLYTEKEIKRCSMFGYTVIDTSFIPCFCRVRVKHVNENKIILDIEIKDKAITDKLKGQFKLRFNNSVPNVADVFRYYEN